MAETEGNILNVVRNRKKELAEKDGTVVVWGRTSDTRIAYSLLNAVDLALNRLRNGMGYKYDIQVTADAISEYNEILKRLAGFAERVCEITGVEIRMPRSFKEALGIKVNNDQEISLSQGTSEIDDR